MPGAVLVVGSGQSGGQVVKDLLGAGRTVYWSVSRVTRVPRRHRGRDILEWLVASGFHEVPVESVTDPAVRGATMPIISGVGRYGHRLSLRWLASRGATLVGRIMSVAGDVLQIEDSVADCSRFADTRSAEVCRQIDDCLRATGQPSASIEPDPADVPYPDPGSVRSPRRLDLDTLDISSVIWCTGVKGDFRWLPREALAEDGTPRHDHGASPLPGIHVIGLPWLTRRGSAIIHAIEPDARLIAGRVAAEVGASS